MKKLLLFVGFILLPAWLQAAPVPSKPVNLLFIMTDQQRWDALGCYGNPVIKTPNLDRLASEGARFSHFYSACPVCVPARTSILTGHGIDANQVLSNGDVKLKDDPPFPSFDQILLKKGYVGEYHGKFHSPYKLALDYSQPVRWLNGSKPAGCKAEISEAEAFRLYVAERSPKRSMKPGELSVGAGIYMPIPLDPGYGQDDPGNASQGTAYGRLEAAPETSRTVFTTRDGMAALERLKGQAPFTLTISIDPPHPPMVVSEPYYSMYPPKDIPVPESIDDPRANSPYRDSRKEGADDYRDPSNIQQMRSIYYGMVTQVDDEVGKILKRLDELGLAHNTLVIFTSDHGEMLGDHGMHSKGVFYEGSSHVPLLMRLPGVIPANTVIDTPTSHLDLFPTILDYCGKPPHESAGRSLRPLIESKDDGTGWVAVSEWNSTKVPGFMVFDGRWKYMCGRTADAPSLDALYDLKTDPNEIENLIGKNSECRAETKRMKDVLVAWLEQVKSPCLDSVKARPIQ
jgi:arylsulfatase A-like enzyme